MARLYYERDYDLYRLASYKEVGAWKEFFDLLSPVLLLFGLVFGGLLFAGMQGGLPVTLLLVMKFASLTIGSAVGATVLLISSKHPNPFIRNAIQLSPLLIIVLLYIF